MEAWHIHRKCVLGMSVSARPPYVDFLDDPIAARKSTYSADFPLDFRVGPIVLIDAPCRILLAVAADDGFRYAEASRHALPRLLRRSALARISGERNLHGRPLEFLLQQWLRRAGMSQLRHCLPYSAPSVTCVSFGLVLACEESS
jgi:hypothetical protein